MISRRKFLLGLAAFPALSLAGFKAKSYEDELKEAMQEVFSGGDTPDVMYCTNYTWKQVQIEFRSAEQTNALIDLMIKRKKEQTQSMINQLTTDLYS